MICWRFDPVSFKTLDAWGQIDDGAIANWPITYEELEPYYTKFEYRFGVSGDADQIVHGPPRSKPYPLPPIEQGYATNHFAQSVDAKSSTRTTENIMFGCFFYRPIPMLTVSLFRD
ncbi:hypothetical protein [Ferviditalea candida]|uniref:Uncharacterized protein n=1 Tax=Ferviditalea candida TaxID=3108399 RepID=A0ABU5ZJ74_9BACL|nr:hypothetical protein [Paenibacillaceae bacterium T2]